jgi:hypothetical protein
MAFFRGIGLGVMAFLLFLLVLILGLSINANFTVLNPGFINGQIQKLDVADVVREEVLASGAIRETPQAVHDFLQTELPEYSVELKEAVAEAVNRFYDYLLGRTDTLDLPVALGETILDPELLYSLADRIDWADLAEEMVQRNISDQLNPVFSYLTDYIDDATVKLDGWFKTTLREVVTPLQEYLLGQRDTLTIAIDLGEPVAVMYQTLFDVYNRFPPPEVSNLTPLQRQMAFNDFFFYELTAGLPAVIEIDSAAFEGTPEAINQALMELQVDLAQIKDYVNYYRFGFLGLLVAIAALASAAYLVLRERRKWYFYTGLTLFITGLVGFVTVMATNAAIGINTDFGSVPTAVHLWLPGLVESAIRPFLLFSILIGALGITGIILAQLDRTQPPALKR